MNDEKVIADPGAEAERKAIETAAMKAEVARLRFDVRSRQIEVARFDPTTGANLGNNEHRAWEVTSYNMLKQAAFDMQQALGYDARAAFSSWREATPLPPLQQDPESGKYTAESLRARLDVFRGDTQVIVERYESGGGRIPSFDGRTGEPIPKDSLRVLQEINDASVEADVQLGLRTLQQMKRSRESGSK